MLITNTLLAVIIVLLVLDIVLKNTKSSERVNIREQMPDPIDLDPAAKWDNTTQNLVKHTPISHTDSELYDKELAKKQGR